MVNMARDASGLLSTLTWNFTPGGGYRVDVERDVLGREVARSLTTANGVARTSVEYDGLGRPSLIVDADSRETHLRYNAFGELVRRTVIDPGASDGGLREEILQRDGNGNVIRRSADYFIDGEVRTLVFTDTYDKNDRSIATTGSTAWYSGSVSRSGWTRRSTGSNLYRA